MGADHFEILVEEHSMEAFLSAVLPILISDKATFRIHTHQGKPDLIKKLPAKLKGYSKWIPESWKLIVLVDRDSENCIELKAELEGISLHSGMTTKTSSPEDWQVANRIAIEELEAWYFGHWSSVMAAYPRVPNISSKSAYKHCDQIMGGTAEALERILIAKGYHKTGLRKVEAALAIASHFSCEECLSPSFIVFRDTLLSELSKAP